MIPLRTFAALALPALLLLAPDSALAQGPPAPVDLSGSWTFTVVTENGTGTPAVVLEQDGSEVIGTYASPRLGTRRLVGTVQGDTLTFRLAPGEGGADVIMTFTGTIQDDGDIAGTVDFGGMGGAAFRARRTVPGHPAARIGDAAASASSPRRAPPSATTP